MSDKVKKSLLKYGVTTAIGLAAAYLVCSLKDVWHITDKMEKYRVFSDAFTLPGIIIVCVGFLVWLANKEYFMSLSYFATRAVRALIPFGRTYEKHETLHDYVMRKREKEPVKGYGFLFIVGLAFVAVAVIFLILYHNAEPEIKSLKP